MDAELKKKWLVALRSGDYMQGNDVLRTKADGYCCLGVLCNVIDPTRWQLAPKYDHYYAYRFGDGDDTRLDSTEIPTNDRDWYGISFDNMNQLMVMNDGGRLRPDDSVILSQTFEQIADWIEENL